MVGSQAQLRTFRRRSKTGSEFRDRYRQGQDDIRLEHRLRIRPVARRTHLAYVARTGAARQLYLRRLDEVQATAMPGTEHALAPFFSPDGRWVAYYSADSVGKVNELRKVPVDGGPPQALCNAWPPGGGTNWRRSRRPLSLGPRGRLTTHPPIESRQQACPLTRPAAVSEIPASLARSAPRYASSVRTRSTNLMFMVSSSSRMGLYSSRMTGI